MSVRRAFVWASLGRYLVMAINLGATLILARLLVPAEYGVTVLGAAVVAIAEALRALGGGSYLIQQRDLTEQDTRSCFTVGLLATFVVIATVLWSAAPLGRFFKVPALEGYLPVAMLGYLTGAFGYPIAALMSRRMAFGALARVNVLTALANAFVGVALALQGYSYMSFAWAGAVSSFIGMLLYFQDWKAWSNFRPSLREWRSVIGFGVFDSLTSVVSQIAEAIPYFIFVRLISPASVGLSQRAIMLCLMPERILLAGVGAVALPSFSQQVRDGRKLREAYLRAVELITSVQWPALLLLMVLADPLVAVLLGPRWREVVPLVQILAAALLCSFPLVLQYATLVATGAIRYMPGFMLLQSVASIGVLTLAARHGLHAAFLSTLAILPCDGLLALALARHFVGFRWADVVAATRKSIVCALLSAVGPIAVEVIGRGARVPVGGAILAATLSAVGWIGGLWVTGHPMLQEVWRAAAAVRRKLGR